MKKKYTLKLGIVGHGFVGKATDYGFSINVKKFIVDPLLNTTIQQLSDFNPEIIFICVPTPMNNDGSQDTSIINSVVRELIEKCPSSIKVIKSTVLPSTLSTLKRLDKKIIYNPEFLREKHANDDFIKSDMIIFGGQKKLSKIISEAYEHHSKCLTTNYIFTDLETASLIKYCINTFLATKVIFFNEMHDAFKSLEVSDNWEDFAKIISNDKRIGDSHMSVPGHDGKKGFGGACFPKDTMALLKWGKDIGIDMSQIESAIRKNNEIRSKYKSLDIRESEQNISFDDKI